MTLQDVSDLATIITAVIAVLATGRFWILERCRRAKLEGYLRKRKADTQGKGQKGQHTLLHLMVALGLTEAQILQASFSSKHIRRTASSDEKGRAEDMFLEYREGSQ